jgi:hypothetical protein
MLVMMAVGLVLADGDAPTVGSHSESSFKTRKPSEAPAGFGDGFGGLILLAFLLGFVGLGVSIVATCVKLKQLVLPHLGQERPERMSDLRALDE